MKNIHVLPTDKPSRLLKNNKSKELFLVSKIFVQKNDINTNQHSYITSDEEIKEGDWCYYENGDLKGIHKVVNGQRPKTMILKKIILTTDQDLINDGVQAIDDEFLELFVKNPSCEEVKVELHVGSLRWSDSKNTYKIIIQQEEESKQETLEEIANKLSIKEAKDLDLFLKGIEWQKEKDRNKFSEEEVELIANEMVNWAIDNIGNPFPQSGKKFDEVMAKFRKE